MSNASRDLELLVAKIQRQLAPHAEVIHDVQLDGRQSNRKRQVDVLVRQRIGQYEVKIVIDCKDYARPVDVKGVEEFYGLLDDVGAQKGVLDCPGGFSKAAKERAERWQIDLYSPIDTDPHKWQVKPTIPAICDFRTAAISCQIRITRPLPFTLLPDFFSKGHVYDKESKKLETPPLDTAINKWNEGRFPIDPGEYRDIPVFDTLEVMADNGHGMIIPVELSASLRVEKRLYFGQFPVLQISGFKDERSGDLITNAFTVGILSPDEVERDWTRVSAEYDAPIKPVMCLIGLVGWPEP